MRATSNGATARAPTRPHIHHGSAKACEAIEATESKALTVKTRCRLVVAQPLVRWNCGQACRCWAVSSLKCNNGAALPASCKRCRWAALVVCAYSTCWQIQALSAFRPVVVDGPFSRSSLIMTILAGLLSSTEVFASIDSIDGTVRGSWSPRRWTEPTLLDLRISRAECPEQVAVLLR